MSNCNSLGDHVARHVGRSTKVALRNEEQDANLARLQGIKRALLQAKSVVLQELSSNVTASDVNLTEARADVLDLSASELERNMCLLLKERGRNKLRAIDDALERIEEEQFRRYFELMGAQRHLKAAGIFARLCHRDGKSAYLADVPRALSYIVELGPRYPELGFVIELIESRVLPGMDATE